MLKSKFSKLLSTLNKFFVTELNMDKVYMFKADLMLSAFICPSSQFKVKEFDVVNNIVRLSQVNGNGSFEMDLHSFERKMISFH